VGADTGSTQHERLAPIAISSALLRPAAGLASPAGAVDAGISRHLCHKSQYGTTVWIEIVNRENGKRDVFAGHRRGHDRF
jgi:hypothetical protein